MKILLIMNLTTRLGKKYHDDMTRLHNALYADQSIKLSELNGREGFKPVDTVDEVWSPGTMVALAVTDDGEAVGFLSFSMSGKNATRWLWIHNFFVDPNMRGKGVGNMLMRTVKEYGKSKGCTFMQLTVLDNNSPAIAMYQKFGFRTEMQDMVSEI